jgi:acetyltransferase-like isoleucine patch superfamily enzyme
MTENFSELHMIGYGGLGRELEFLIGTKYPKINIIVYDDVVISTNVKKTVELEKIEYPINCLIAIGDPNGKLFVYNKLKKNKHIIFPNIILSNFESYNFSIDNIIGSGNILMPQCVIGYNTIIGDFNLFGVNSGLGHDVKIGNFNFIGPNCFLAGNVNISDNCKLSFGTFVLQKVTLTSNINTMPYTCVYKHLKTAGSYHGNPARII